MSDPEPTVLTHPNGLPRSAAAIVGGHKGSDAAGRVVGCDAGPFHCNGVFNGTQTADEQRSPGIPARYGQDCFTCPMSALTSLRVRESDSFDCGSTPYHPDSTNPLREAPLDTFTSDAAAAADVSGAAASGQAAVSTGSKQTSASRESSARLATPPKQSLRVRRNTRELIRKRTSSRGASGLSAAADDRESGSESGSVTASSAASPSVQLAPDLFPPADGSSPHRVRSPALKPKAAAPRRQSLLSSAIHRAASMANIRMQEVDQDVARALRDGVVCDDDVNVYGLRTAWQGLRHMEKHSERVPAEAPAPLAARAAPHRTPSNRLAGMRRTETCPKRLTDFGQELVKPEFRKKNIRPFHEVYELGPVLGTGGFAVVRHCTHKATRAEYAVKLLTVVADGVEEAQREVTHRMMMDELQMMMGLEHDNIIRLKEFFFDAGVCCIVMQLLRGEDLMDQLNDGGHSQADVKVVMQRLLDAISYMHDHGISHRDLKLENLVLARHGDLTSVTIVDFGLAKAARARQQMKGVVGTTHYCAPEILLASPYTPVVDSWSLGVVMYLLLTGQYPFHHEDEDELEDMIIDKEPSYDGSLWAGISHEAMDLVKGLLEKNPMYRLTPQEALEHAWFTGHELSDSHTLKHVHKRMEHICSNKNLPARHYKRGEWIVRQGDRFSRHQEAFLVVSGEAEVLLQQPGHELAAPDGFVHLGVRRAGNFVGAMTVHYVDPPDAPGMRAESSPKSNPVSSPTGFNGPASSSPGSQRTWSYKGDSWSAGAAAASFGDIVTAGSDISQAERRVDRAGLALRVLLTLLRVKHRWVGERRVMSAKALTDVVVLVVSHEDMEWAVAHDYRLCNELSAALKKRRLAIKNLETVVRGKGKQGDA